ncbi:hypothetical protein OG817_40545 [Kribbella sp. NBC_00889]|nr:hypothetical protein OG817_40545 [Kribbella sp. NBC_00889]
MAAQQGAIEAGDVLRVGQDCSGSAEQRGAERREVDRIRAADDPIAVDIGAGDRRRGRIAGVVEAEWFEDATAQFGAERVAGGRLDDHRQQESR